jgi:hypothetical protein
MPLFDLTLHKTYYKQGFFNVPVDYQGYVRPSDGPVELILGTSGTRIEGRVDRRANQNGTPRIFGGAKLRDWFQRNCAQGGIVRVDLSSFDSIQFRTSHVEIVSPLIPDTTEEIPVEVLAVWRRRIVRPLNSLCEGPHNSVAATINAVSHSGRIPREIAACMRLVTEMRNATEYEGKRLSHSESAAVRNSWNAIIEWAEANGLAI